MERYAQAKMRLFRSPGLAHAVLNLDDALGVRIAQDRAGTGVARTGYTLWPGTGAASGLDHWLEAHDIELSSAGAKFALVTSRGRVDVATALVGRFNVANVLGVIGVLLAAGLPLDAAVAGRRGAGAACRADATPRRGGEAARRRRLRPHARTRSTSASAPCATSRAGRAGG